MSRKRAFSIDADNQSFPPSISGIQNGIIAHAMNQREQKSSGAKIELTAASNIEAISANEWMEKCSAKSECSKEAKEG